MKKNPMDIAVVCENEEQREHALEIAKASGIAFGKWWREIDTGNTFRVYESGDWMFLNWDGGAETTLTYADFIAQYGQPATEQPQPDPITELTKRLEAVEQRVFGNSEWPTVEEIIDGAKDTRVPITEPQPEAIYGGVFWFEGTGRASCINGQQTMAYSDSDDTWLIWSSEDLPKHRHRLVPVKEFTVGKWYACAGEDLNTPFAYSMYLGDNRFVSWTMKEDYPILIHNQEKWRVQRLEVHPA